MPSDPEMSRGRPVVVVVGQTPPPYHGQAIAIAEVVNASWDELDVRHVRLAYSRAAGDIGRFSLAKVLHLFSRAWMTVRLLRRNPGAVLYYPPGGNLVPIMRDVVFMFLVRRYAGRLILHYHACGMAEVFEGRPWLRKLALLAFGRVDAAVKLQPSVPPDAESLNPERVVIIPNGLDVPEIKALPKSSDAPVRILFAGLHTEEKGIFIVVDVLEKLVAMGLNVEVRSMGSWRAEEEERRCHRLVEQKKLGERISFLGTLSGDEKWREYAAADVLFFPTFYRAELMPLVVIEAMAFGLPVVASEWRGLRDMIDSGQNGFLFPIDDKAAAVDMAADCLARLVREPGLRRKVGTAARRSYQLKYTLAKHLDAMHRLFLEVSGGC